jgi:shikimate dehydrogenase
LSQANATPGVPHATIITGLVGRHIGASRSPWLHEREAQAQGLTLTYNLLDFAALGRDETYLCAQLDTAARLGYSGLNVTYPYKQAVIVCLDELAPTAARVGAVNTVKFSGSRRIGHNTDVVGFAESMREGLPDVALNVVLQIGAGGGGAATGQALLELGVGRLVICDQDRRRAAALVAKLRAAFGSERVEQVDDPQLVVAEADGVVNATPMGMAANPQAPFDTSLLIPRHWVADIVYFPLETQLLRAARQRGCRTLDGSGMVVHQAAAAFEIFTGRKADRRRMLRSFMEFSLEP